MKPTKDVFGEIIQQYHQGLPCSEVIERSDGYVSSNSLEKYFKEYKNWDKIDKVAMTHASGLTLDIGCGAGKHAIYLQEQGLDVIAVDSSRKCVEVAKAQGVRNSRVHAIEDIHTLKNQSFETVLLLGANLGLLGSRSKAKRTLKSLYQATTPAAKIIGTTVDYTTTTEKAHKLYQKKNLERKRLAGTVRMRIRWKDMVGEWFDYLLLTESDLRSVLQGTGWEISEVISNEDSPNQGYILTKLRPATPKSTW